MSRSEAAGGDTRGAGRYSKSCDNCRLQERYSFVGLVDGKVTFVHRRLWPAVVRMAEHFPTQRLAQVHEEHTVAGHHVTRDVPFPDWVTAEVVNEARKLDERQALNVLVGGLRRNRQYISERIPRGHRSKVRLALGAKIRPQLLRHHQQRDRINSALMAGSGQLRRINDSAGMSARPQIAAVSLRCSELALRARCGLLSLVLHLLSASSRALILQPIRANLNYHDDPHIRYRFGVLPEPLTAAPASSGRKTRACWAAA